MNLSEATAAVQAAQKIVVVTHIHPDGDAIGTQLGIVNALRALGKQVTAAVDGGAPETFAFLTGSESILPTLTGDPAAPWDLAISVDASEARRSGRVGEVAFAHSRQVINLDHHITNTLFGDYHLVNPAAVSATEIAYDWLDYMGAPLTPEVSIPLLTGLVTDTMGFRTSNVTARTLEIAQRLISAGASLTLVTARTLDTKPYNTMKLWKQVFHTIELEDGVIYACVTRADLEAAYGAGVSDHDASDGGLSGLLVQVNEAMVSAVFRETADGQIELSLRSKQGYDVSAVAVGVGGGGHRQAAGATIPGTLDEAITRILPQLKDAVRAGTLTIAQDDAR